MMEVVMNETWDLKRGVLNKYRYDDERRTMNERKALLLHRLSIASLQIAIS
jgi:hypothetical protein